MRLTPVPVEEMSDEQRDLHGEMEPELDEKLKGFVSQRDDGALLGPFAPMIAWPAWGRGFWIATKTLLDHTVLPRPAHEEAILVTGARFNVGYELYAHERVAEGTNLFEQRIATIVASERPCDLTAEESAAYDVDSHSRRGRPVPVRRRQLDDARVRLGRRRRAATGRA